MMHQNLRMNCGNKCFWCFARGDSDDDASESNNVSALSGELSDMDNGASSEYFLYGC